MPARLVATGGWTALIAVLAVLCLACGGLTFRTLLLLAILLGVAAPLAFKSMRGRLDVFEPLVFANLALGVMFLGRPLADLATGATHHHGYGILSTFDEALVVALCGVLAFQFGYGFPAAGAAARTLPQPPAFKPGRAAIAAWIFLVIGAGLFWAFLSAQGGMGLLRTLLEGRAAEDNDLFLGSSGYLYNGILLFAASALIFFALATLAHRRHHYVSFAMLVLPLLVFYGARGTRSQLLPLVVAVPVFWYLSRERRPRVATTLVCAMLGLAVLGWMREVRNAGERGDAWSKLGAALMSPVEQFGDMLTGMDAEMFDSLANELSVIPEQLPFQHGATLTDSMVRAVPRPLWPNKPLESNDAIVETLWPEHHSKSRAGPAFSIVGVFYADSGLATVVLGMFSVGFACAVLWAWHRRHRHLILARLVYSMALPLVVIFMRGTITDILSRALFLVVPLGLLFVLTRLRSAWSAP